MAGRIRVGVGGWTFEPWRGVFFPDGLAQKRELEYASRKLTAIEINGTYYGSQKPESFRKWASETPEDFVFSVKGSRFCTNRKVLADGRESIERFLGSGITELGSKLGPILWQFANTKKFDEADFRGFLELLPEKQDGLKLRHALEVRHASFCDPAFMQENRAELGVGDLIVRLVLQHALELLDGFIRPFLLEQHPRKNVPQEARFADRFE